MAKERETIQDHSLPMLAKALNTAYMEERLREHLAGIAPGRKTDFSRFCIERIFHRPGKDCRILYKLHYVVRGNFQRKLLLNGVMRAGKNGQAGDETSDKWPGCDGWPPLSYLSDLNLLLYTFPYDPKLPYLGQLLEEAYVKQQILAHLEGFELSGEWKCGRLRRQIRKYRPFKKCLIRFQIALENQAGERKHFAFYSKTYTSRDSRYVFDVLQQIYQSPAVQRGYLHIPRPVAHLDEVNSFWLLEWRGKALSAEVARKGGWERFAKTIYPEKIAFMLAALHQIRIVGTRLKPGPSPEMIFTNARIHGGEITRFLPRYKKELERFYSTLEAVLGRQQAEIPRATIHGTFKLAQILCQADKLALVDFDSVGEGDPLYDIAEFAASLSFLRVTDGVSHAAIRESLDVLLEAYSRSVPWSCDTRRLAGYVVAFLIGKMHATLKRGEKNGPLLMRSAINLISEWLAMAT